MIVEETLTKMQKTTGVRWNYRAGTFHSTALVVYYPLDDKTPAVKSIMKEFIGVQPIDFSHWLFAGCCKEFPPPAGKTSYLGYLKIPEVVLKRRGERVAKKFGF